MVNLSVLTLYYCVVLFIPFNQSNCSAEGFSALLVPHWGVCLGVFWSRRAQTVLWVSRQEWNWMLKWLNASSVMRKCLKLSAAAWTKRSGLIKTRIFCVPPRQSRRRSKRSCFHGETNSCSLTLCLHYTKVWCLKHVCGHCYVYVLVSVLWKEL